jgi:hypothetical protein
VDAVTGLIGVFGGWALSSPIRQLSRRIGQVNNASASPLGWLTPVLFVTWFAFVAFLFWRPFGFSIDPVQFAGDDVSLTRIGFRHFALAPFADYYWGSKYQALDLFVKKGLSFVPLGILLALASRDPMQRGLTTMMIMLAVGSALILEVGRYFLPGRIPSAADLIIAAFGAMMGFLFMRKVRLLLWAESNLWANSPIHREFSSELTSSLPC